MRNTTKFGELTIAGYQDEVIATSKNYNSPNDALIGNTLGMAGEVGEFVEKLKHKLYHGHPIKLKMLAEELGDIMWYLTAAASELDIKLEDIMKGNLLKLRKRYPEGFSKERSLNRTEGTPDK